MKPKSKLGLVKSGNTVRYLFSFCWLILSLCLAFLVSWTLLVKQNLLYVTAYHYLDIEHTISYYGPRNHYKIGFENTSKSERVSLFGQILDIVDSIPINLRDKHQRDLALQHSLSQLHYVAIKSNRLALVKTRKINLLRQAEIDHLIDVAHLIYYAKTGALVASMASVTILLFFYWFRVIKRVNIGVGELRQSGFNKQFELLPRITTIYLMMLTLIISSMLCIYLIGAESLFYILHEWVFPAEHQWFFYYEHSLMSMLMQAPNLFAFVAMVLLIYILVSQYLILFISRYLLAIKLR